ncbi:MAG: hypothetical protein R3242_08150, partial [Akkermansiaceae bacterium]|nr:hypothetical protein [Akkermansiaceae bacterium]
ILPSLLSGHGISLTAAFKVVWVVVLMTSTIMALFGALELSGRSKTITAIGVVYFLLGAFQVLVIARMFLS